MLGNHLLNICFSEASENFRFSTENKAYKIALGDKTGLADLFIDSDGGDSSLVYFGKEKKIQVETRTLDTFNFENIKQIPLW